MEPEQTRGRLAGPTKALLVEGKLDLPIGGGGLRREEGQGSLAELHPGASIRIGGEQKFARDRRSVSPAPPDGLAFAEMPPRFGEIDRSQRRQRAAGGQKGAKQKENKMAQPSRPPTGGPAEGLAGGESALGCFFQDYTRELRATSHPCHYSTGAGVSNGVQNQAVVDKTNQPWCCPQGNCPRFLFPSAKKRKVLSAAEANQAGILAAPDLVRVISSGVDRSDSRAQLKGR